MVSLFIKPYETQNFSSNYCLELSEIIFCF